MKECPKCGELNGDNNERCYKCNTVLEAAPSYRVCPKCKTIYSAKSQTCERCGVPLAVYTAEMSYASTGSADKWMYVIAVLFPLIGIILGMIYLARREDDIGKPVLIASVVASIVWGVVFSFIFLL